MMTWAETVFALASAMFAPGSGNRAGFGLISFLQEQTARCHGKTLLPENTPPGAPSVFRLLPVVAPFGDSQAQTSAFAKGKPGYCRPRSTHRGTEQESTEFVAYFIQYLPRSVKRKPIFVPPEGRHMCAEGPATPPSSALWPAKTDYPPILQAYIKPSACCN